MKNHSDKPLDRSVTVIGAGIVGICCAWYLSERGYQVTVIDPATSGSKTSFGNAGCISPSHVVPFSHPGIMRELPKWLLQKNSPLIVRWRQALHMLPWLKQFWRSGSKQELSNTITAISALMQSVEQDWANLIAKTQAQDFIQQQGVLKVFDTPARLAAHRWELDISQQRGFEWHELSGLKLQSLEPALKITDSMRAAYFPAWQHILDPQGITQHIAEQLRTRQVSFVNDKVMSVQVANNSVHISTLSGKTLQTEKCVIAAGVWSDHLAKQLDHAVPLVAKRGYHNMLHHSGFEIQHPILPMDDYFLITPMQQGVRVAGMAEFDLLDAEPDYRRADLLLKRTQKYFPQAKFEYVTQWMGQRPMLPDSLPIISRSPRYDNIYYAFGHGHYGLTQGPTTGRLIANLVTDERSYEQMNLTDYQFDRFI